MSEPYKQLETLKYTEWVYYDAFGNEVDRERNHDDWSYDIGDEVPLTEQEIEDYID